MIHCPKCGLEVSDESNFCPMDGTPLADVRAAATAAAAAAATPYAVDDDDSLDRTDPMMTPPGAKEPRPAPKPRRPEGFVGATEPMVSPPIKQDTDPLPASAPRKGRRQPAPAAGAPAGQNAAAPGPAGPGTLGRPAPRKTEGSKSAPMLGRRKQRERARPPQEAKTQIFDAIVVPDGVASPRKPASVPAGGPAGASRRSAAPEGGSAKKAAKAKRRFSETAWFMAAQTPEDLQDEVTGTDAEVESERYEVEGKLPDKVRKEFSLNKSDILDENNEKK